MAISAFSVGQKAATTPTLTNVVVVAADIEQSFVLPDKTKFFELRNRGKGIMKYTYTALASGTTYSRLSPGNIHCKAGISTTSLTIYFQSSKDGVAEVLEVESWQ